jgi:hypothetical protein
MTLVKKVVGWGTRMNDAHRSGLTFQGRFSPPYLFTRKALSLDSARFEQTFDVVHIVQPMSDRSSQI